MGTEKAKYSVRKSGIPREGFNDAAGWDGHFEYQHLFVGGFSALHKSNYLDTEESGGSLLSGCIPGF
jgi:hypothetical protein